MMTLSAYPARYLFVSAASLFAADSGGSSANASAGVRQPSTRMGLLSVSSAISCSSRAMEGGDGRAFGRVAADHAVPVLVAAAPPRAARVGEIRGHARFVAQPGVPGELGAVVMRHSGAGGGRQPGEHGLLRRHARGGGLVGHDLRPWGNGRAARPRCAGCGPAPMTPSASRSPKRLPSSCPHGRSQIDVRKRDAAAARTPAAGLAPAPSAARQAPGPPLPPGLAGVYPPADDLRAAARHGAAGMLHGEAPAYRRRRGATVPARPMARRRARAPPPVAHLNPPPGPTRRSLPTGANTPGPSPTTDACRPSTPPFGYPDNLQSNGCCTFN